MNQPRCPLCALELFLLRRAGGGFAAPAACCLHTAHAPPGAPLASSVGAVLVRKPLYSVAR